MYEVLLIGLIAVIVNTVDTYKRNKLIAKRMYKGGAI